VLTVGGDSPQNDEAVGFNLQNTYKLRIFGPSQAWRAYSAQSDDSIQYLTLPF